MCSSGLLPDLMTYSILLDGLCIHGYLDEALKLLKSMQEKKLEPDIVLCTILIEGMFIAGKLEVAKELFFQSFCGWSTAYYKNIHCHDQGTS
ncbi:hypothetical protein OIU76_002853 [Salix suchowensis]|nr:hypothetical protein OIU76_002853 [Salix suchowensis]